MTPKIIHKPILATKTEDYQELEVEQFLKYHREHADELSIGESGIYLSRRVFIDSETYYFLLIDMDSDPQYEGDDKIASAILNTAITCRALKEIDILDKFFVIATGGTGFRLVSNILVDENGHGAFVDLLKNEMDKINDLQPSKDINMPHQLIAYKGNPLQNDKILYDRHSQVVTADEFLNETMTVERYKELTDGYLDPNDALYFMETFLKFEPITDLTILGRFRTLLQTYIDRKEDIINNRFDNIVSNLKRKRSSISIEAVHKMLLDNKKLNRIEQRERESISFKGLPCPVCGKTTSNAYAFPPNYTLYCLSQKCEAHKDKGGMHFQKWSGICKDAVVENSPTPENYFGSLVPIQKTTKQDARKIIESELNNDEDVLIKVTPGVGKTTIAVTELAKMKDEKIIFYSSCNTALKEEANNVLKRILDRNGQDAENIFLIKPRDQLCSRKDELNEITTRGYSPAEILCSNCHLKKSCEYYHQKDFSKPGIYFLTHNMLKHIDEYFRVTPDLIVLDDDIMKGFFNEETSTRSQLRDLKNILKEDEYEIIEKLINFASDLANHSRQEKLNPILINTNQLVDDSIKEETLISILAKKLDISEDLLEAKLMSMALKCSSMKDSDLYKKRVDKKAVDWFHGMAFSSICSYLLISKNGDNIHFNYKSTVPLGFSKTTVKILDATGNKNLADALTERDITFVEAEVDWQGNSTHIIKSTYRTSMKWRKDEELIPALTEALKNISSQNVLIITYKDEIERTLKLCQAIDGNRQYKTHYFHDARGVNTFSDCDGVLVVGTPLQNITSCYQDALILFPKNKISEIADSWSDYCCTSELLQSIHRARPVNKKCIDLVVIAKYWPADIPSPQTIKNMSRTKNKLELAISRLDPYVQEFGFLNPDIGPSPKKHRSKIVTS